MIKKLISTYGVAGLEASVSSVIQEELKKMHLSYDEDSMGNLHVYKEGEGAPTMLAAYMDEPGIIITKITEDGYLKFDLVGRIDASALVSKHVTIEGQSGIISLKAIHLTKKAERETPVNVTQLFVDIGAKNRAEAEKYITIGDYGAIESAYHEMENGWIKGRAPGGRMGCFAVLEVLKRTPHAVHAIFAVQREIGCRGMMASMHRVKAKRCMVFDGIQAANPGDITDQAPQAGQGVVLPRRCGGMQCDETLWRLANQIADEKKIPIQHSHQKEKGQESIIAQSGTGCACLCLDIPVRYMRSATQVVSRIDVQGMIDLASEIINKGGIADETNL